MTGSHTRWARPEAEAEDPERIAIREALAFGKAVYDRRAALGLSVAELAMRVGMTTDEIECGKTRPQCPISGNRPRFGFLTWDEESSMTRDPGSTIPFA